MKKMSAYSVKLFRVALLFVFLSAIISFQAVHLTQKNTSVRKLILVGLSHMNPLHILLLKRELFVLVQMNL